MNEAEFRLHEEIESDHFWFVGKRMILRTLLASNPPRLRMLDLGCGTGGVLRDWNAQVPSFGSDRSELALRICAREGSGHLARGDLRAIPFRAGSFDTILALDVIEHLDDDVGFLRDASELCAPGGRLIVSVPAFQALWSQHDETFEHRRRYSGSQLRDVVLSAGLEIERITYTHAMVFPLAAVWRIVSFRLGVGRFAPAHDFWPIPKWLNRILVALYRVETWLLERVNLPFGVSVVCIARSRPEPQSM